MADKTPEVQALIRTVNIHTIQKQQLSSICQRVSIPKTGNKADLIRRIVEQINISANSQDWARFEEIRRTIAAITGLNSTPVVSQTTSASTSTSATASSLPQPYPQPRSQGTYYQPIPPNPNSPQYHAMASYGGPGYGPSQGSGIPGHPSGINGASRPAPAQNFNFKPSPFYEMKRQIGRTSTLEVMTQHRNTSRFQLSISEDPILSRCATDDSIKVMVFSAGSNDPNQDIAFPHQCEIKVNGDDIKANLRGLKNKPGSTRPVDITHALRFRPATYMNSIEVTYALTQKQFFVSIIVCKMIPVETLVGQITKKIPKVSVIAEITRQNNDDEIEATSQNLSLKCPLSYMRLQRPCRALACNHIQCFDATSYLQLQEQGPQWMCPICNKPAPFDQLAIDEYALDILSRTNESVEQVTIDPNGQWKVPGAKDDVAVAPVKSEAASFVLDDDLVISEVPLRGDRSTITPSMTSVSATYIGTPNSGLSRDTSAAPRSSSKRPAPEVIDLTLSDDEEEARPPKRVNYGNTNSSRNYHSYNGNGNSY